MAVANRSISMLPASRSTARRLAGIAVLAGRLDNLRSASVTRPAWLDYLVGGGEQLIRHVESERLGGFEVDDQLVRGRSLNRKLVSLGFPEALVDEDLRLPPLRPSIHPPSPLWMFLSRLVDWGRLVCRGSR
jgi:hypothetical protein